MTGVVDPPDLDHAIVDVDLVQGARVLRHLPVGRQRLIEELEQQRFVDAVVADHHHGLFGMARERDSQRIGRPRHQVLQRLAAGKARQLGSAAADVGRFARPRRACICRPRSRDPSAQLRAAGVCRTQFWRRSPRGAAGPMVSLQPASIARRCVWRAPWLARDRSA